MTDVLLSRRLREMGLSHARSPGWRGRTGENPGTRSQRWSEARLGRFPREFLLYVVLLVLLVGVALREGLLGFLAQPGEALFLLGLMVAASLLTV